MSIDPQTGRPLGDHGTGTQAIEWLLNVNTDNDHYNREAFLKAWQEGSAWEEWPEFYEWLATQAAPPMTAPTTPALDREAVAKIIDPLAFPFEVFATWDYERVKRQDAAFAKADAILTLTQASAAKVPEGWKLVPEKATAEMFAAWGRMAHDSLQASYVAMLAATPSETANG